MFTDVYSHLPVVELQNPPRSRVQRALGVPVEVQHKQISWTYGLAFALTLGGLLWYHRQPAPVAEMQ